MKRAMALAERCAHPNTLGWTTFACGYACYFAGRFRASLRLLEQSLRILEECSGAAFETATVKRTHLMCLAHLGEIKELARLRPQYVREAFDRGDLFGVVNMRLGYSNIAALAQDDPDEARAEIAESLRQWSKKGFHLEHYFALIARANADLYAGDDASALAVMTQQWPALKDSLLLTVQSVRVLSRWGRGRAALATAWSRPSERWARLRLARRDARALRREHAEWSQPIAALLEAGIAMVDADDERRARALLEEAAAGFDGVDMALHAAAARRCLGAIVRGEEGGALVEAADAWMASEGIVSPARMTAMLAPGFRARAV
jgi:hypothetical protein